MKLFKFCTVLLLWILCLHGVQAQNGSLCVEALIEVREGNTTVTCEPGAPTWIRFKTSKVNTPYAYAVTDQDGTILRLSISDKVSFTGLPGGQLRVYAFSYIGLILGEEGDNIFMDDLSSICSVVSPNYISVLNIVPEGGTVQSGNGRTTEYICTDDDLIDLLSFTTSEQEEPIYAYIVTDENNQILKSSTDGLVDFTDASTGTCRVWGIAYTGNLLAAAGLDVLTDNLAEGCYDVSDNYVSVIRTEPDGATITANNDVADISACDYPGGSGLNITFGNTNEQTFYYAYIITDVAETTFTVVSGNTINLSNLPMGSSRVRGISYAGQIAEGTGAFADLTSDQTGCFDLSDNFITLTRIYVEGGQVALADGGTEVRACGIDGLPDQFSFQTTSTSQEPYAWILTGKNNVIKSIYTENQISIDEFTDEDDFRVYGISYRGTILSVGGQGIKEALPVDGCYEVSENFVTITRIRPDGGSVSLADGSTDLSGCDTPDSFGQVSIDLANSGKSGFAYTYFLTDNNNKILRIFTENAILLSDLPEGNSRIWGLSYEGNLVANIGDNPDNVAPVDGCFDLSDNFISLERIIVDGGTIALAQGGTEIETCGTDEVPDHFDFQTTSTSQESYAWMLTDKQGIIKKIFTENPVSIDEFTDVDTFKVTGISYRGAILPVVGQDIDDVAQADGCFDLSENSVQITRINPNGGTVSLTDGSTNFTGCDNPDVFGQISVDLANSGKAGYAYVYLLTNRNNRILRIIVGEAIPLSEISLGNRRIWGLSYQGTLIAKNGDNAVDSLLVDGCYDLSDNFISLERIIVDGGTIALEQGGTEIETCGSDDISDQFSFQTDGNSTEAYAWILTDKQDLIRGIFTENPVSIDEFTDVDTFLVRGLSYRGTLLPVIGQNLNTVAPADGCFDLSENTVQITRITPDGGSVSLADGSTDFSGCDSPDVFGQISIDLANSGKPGYTYVYFLTNNNNRILQIITGEAIPLSDLPAGTSRIWGLSYQGTLTANPGDNLLNIAPVDGCFDLSDNFISLERTIVDGGEISILNGGDSALTCGSDNIPDAFTFNSTTTAKNQPYVLVVTDENNRVFSTASGGIIDFDLFAPRTYRIWGLSYTGTLTVPFGSILTNISLSTGCYDLSNNFVTIRQEEANGGQLQFAGGGTKMFTCPDDGNADVLSFVNNGFTSDQYIYLISDENNVILATTTSPNYDFDQPPAATCRIWGLAYSGQLNAPIGEKADTLVFSDECYSLTSNFLEVVKETPTAGSISFKNGGDIVFTCPSDGQSDLIDFVTTSAYEGVYIFLITNENNRVIDVSFNGTYDFDFAEPGNCRVWGVAFTGNWIIQEGSLITEDALSDDCWAITENYVTVVREVPTAGTVSFADGSATKYTCPGDGKADLLNFANTSAYAGSYIYLITDESNKILTSTSDDSFDFDNANLGTCRVWGVAYTGELAFQPGDDAGLVNISDDCFDLSDNFISVVRDNPEGGVISTPGGPVLTLCVGDALADVVQLSVEGASNSQYAYLITDEAGFLIAAITDNQFDFNNAVGGICRIYGLAYTGEITALPGDDISVVSLTSDCSDLSDNFITLNRLNVDGSTLFTGSGSTDIEYICSGDGIPDVVTFQNGNNDAQVSYQYLITNTNNIIIGDLNGNMLDFEGSPFDSLLIWGVAYTGNATLPIGTNITAAVLSDSCYDISNNFITLISDLPLGGTISRLGGGNNIRVCIGGESGLVEMTNTSTSLSGYIYLVTTPEQVIVSTSTDDIIDFNQLEVGNYLIYGLSYTGQLTFAAGDTITLTDLASSCYELSANTVQAERTPALDGGMITSAFGDPLYVCLNDGIPDIGAFETTSSDPNYRYVITDTLNNILIPDIVGNVVDFNKANPGFFRVYGVSFTGNFTATFGTNILENTLSNLCSAVSGNYISLINDNFTGGTVNTEDGATEVDLIVGDGNPDVVSFDSTGTSGVNFTYVITDANNVILSIPEGDSQDFEGADSGICRVWGLSYSGEILAEVGDTASAVILTDGCYVLSENFITVNRIDSGSPYYIPEIFNTASSGMKLQLYPNPVSLSLKVRLRALFENTDPEGRITIEVFDLSGRRIVNQIKDMQQKDNTYELDVQSLPLGMYILRVTNGADRVQQRFYKQ